ncbi:hypothetical protein ACFRAR_31055 [Kitasatospora sp. NPDC056651]|uniref:hypothetical protein n=1 Tax=Kitasatospora sp. NPDC056651 TaxID=3345892 RepID=UPI003678F775
MHFGQISLAPGFPTPATTPATTPARPDAPTGTVLLGVGAGAVVCARRRRTSS